MLSLAERKKVYQVFSGLFRYPDQEYQAVAGAAVAELARMLQFDLAADVTHLPDLAELETAYTGLFVNSLGGVPAPPYGSVYLDPEGLLMGESSLAVAACYAAENLNLQGSDEPPDFLATELEFFYYLLAEEEAALLADNSVRLAELKSRQTDFFEKYLFPWIPEFCKRIAANSPIPFYLWVGDALRQFCEIEKQQMA